MTSDQAHRTWPIWTTIKKLSAAIAALLTIGGCIYGAAAWVDSRIDKALSNPQTLQAIAARVRPAVVFDSKGSIVADQGGLEYLLKIEVLPGDGSVPREIVVTPRTFLPVPPLLESLDEPALNATSERGKGIEWRFTLSGGGYVESGAINPRFRLEIL